MENVQSEYVDERNVDIWLPPSYFVEEVKKYPVLYMHDGQNLFDTTVAYGGVTWGVADWVKKMSVQNKIPEVIVVGIWNTPKRYLEYMPNKPFSMMDTTLQKALIAEYGATPLGDQYLKFIVNELKPMIDSTYRTLPDQKNTFIMGSSMGGLISSYAITEYPDIFRGAGCLSTHFLGSWKNGGHKFSDGFARYFSENLPSPKNHKYYFDYGTGNLDNLYEPHQLKIDSVMEKAGYLKGQNWVTFKFEGAGHNEAAWQERLHIPLNFLLNKN
jgi:predicted alpha/beta superfamily hydrolase